MNRKPVSGILTLLLIGLTLAFNIQPVKASIYIRAHGSVEPSDAPISSVDNITYTFGSSINDYIVIERDNIVLDGAGYTLQGSGSGTGIDLTGRSNVTIKDLKIKAFYYGVCLIWPSNHNNLVGNNITNNRYGIYLQSSEYNDIVRNNLAENNVTGIYVKDSSNNNIFENNITNNQYGVWLWWSSNNCIVGNNITANINIGVWLWGSSNNNSVFWNSLTNNNYAVYVAYSSSNNKLYHNNFIDNTQQVYIQSGGYANFWDKGYPSGGNYWSDYTGIDLYRGPYQNETGRDGIGDTTYIMDVNNQDHYPLMKPYGGDHDIGITDITTSKTIVGQGYNLSITATIFNNGIYTENCKITVYANTTAIASQNVTLTTRNSTTVTFTWNTTGVAKGNYTLWAYAEPVSGETDLDDNKKPDGTVLVTVPGDVNGDRKCDMKDIFQLILHFTCKIGQPCYVANCDINGDGVIDMKDIFTAILHFMEHW